MNLLLITLYSLYRTQDIFASESTNFAMSDSLSPGMTSKDQPEDISSHSLLLCLIIWPWLYFFVVVEIILDSMEVPRPLSHFNLFKIFFLLLIGSQGVVDHNIFQIATLYRVVEDISSCWQSSVISIDRFLKFVVLVLFCVYRFLKTFEWVIIWVIWWFEVF